MDDWQRGSLERLGALIREERQITAEFQRLKERRSSVISRIDTGLAYWKAEEGDAKDPELSEALDRLIRLHKTGEETPADALPLPPAISNNGTHAAPAEGFTLQPADKASAADDKTGIFFDILQTFGADGLTLDEVLTYVPLYEGAEISKLYLYNIRGKQEARLRIHRGEGEKIFLTEKGRAYKVSPEVKALREQGQQASK